MIGGGFHFSFTAALKDVTALDIPREEALKPLRNVLALKLKSLLAARIARPPSVEHFGLSIELIECRSVDSCVELTDPEWNLSLGMESLDDRYLQTLRAC
jgi:hypothetical protein